MMVVDGGDGRAAVRVFLSFASKDVRAAEDLWERLGGALSVSGAYQWDLWMCTDRLIASDDWDERIREALDRSDVGLFALTHALLASLYIREVELKHFLEAEQKRLVPVALKPLAESAGVRELASLQWFGMHDQYWSGSRVGRPDRRDEWACRLADELHRVVRDRLGR